MQSISATRPRGPSPGLGLPAALIDVPSRHDKDVNVGEVERAVSGVLGGTLLLLGLGRPRSLGAATCSTAASAVIATSIKHLA